MQGSLQVRSYTDKEGVKRRAYEVVADNVHFAEPKRDGTPPPRDLDGLQPPPSFSSAGTGDFEELQGGDDDLPF